MGCWIGADAYVPLSARQRLHDIDPAGVAEHIGQMLPVAYRLAVDEYRKMFAQRTLVVEDVTAQPWLLAENGVECFADRVGVDFALGRFDMPLDRSGEEEVRHGGDWQEPRGGDGL